MQLAAETPYADWSIRVYVRLFTSSAGGQANSVRHLRCVQKAESENYKIEIVATWYSFLGLRFL